MGPSRSRLSPFQGDRVHDAEGGPEQSSPPAPGMFETTGTSSEELGAEFKIILRTLGHDDETLSVRPQLLVSELCARGAYMKGWPTFLTKLVIGSKVLGPDCGETLQEAEITDDTDVMLLRRSALKALDPGISRYNSQYFCTVSRVEETGLGAVEVDFCVVGDMSAGKLQKPAASRLCWGSDLGEGDVDERARRLHRFGYAPGITPVSHSFTEEDYEKRIQGTLVYQGLPVPLPPRLGFTFGQGGYDTLHVSMEEVAD